MRHTITDLYVAAIRRDPTRPVLTWYDDGSGERTELSGATLDNWVAKTANLLVDGAGREPGDTAAVLLPPHWQTAAVLLGCWAAGLAVHLGPPAAPVDVLVTAAADAEAAGAGWPAQDRYATGLLPLAGALRSVPAGFVDYVVEVRGHGDRFTPYRPVASGDPAVGGPQAMTHAEAHGLAAGRAAALGIGAGDRVLVDADRHPDPFDWLLAPLAAGASIVLCGRLDAARVAERRSAERITVELR